MTRVTTSSDDAKEDAFAGLRISILGTNQKVPQWVPVTLLAFSSAALVAPIVMLRRYRRSTIAQNLQEAAPPPRRRGLSVVPLRSHSPPIRPHPTTQTNPILTHPPPLKGPVPNKDTADQFFNAPLYTFKAFGIATALVTLGATASIWGVMKALRARDIDEFAERMRHAVLTKLPVLSYRIYRPAVPDQDGGDVFPQTKIPVPGSGVEWNWQEAETRLREAFDKDGFYGWATAVLEEVEAEATVERARRGLIQDQERQVD
ncbi:hypothetical protein AZE42_04519 [Rhizopogon vesiculosus]|uniref:Uncharacterized protein n=1 Tax=Rhizopogon vesiculosus TaxID=180088 RepID=A0A1J8QNM4_9AGAM|nr:hypothetical protein AZE42_04519 [Rhizopogon vesiculosus]